VNVVFCSFYLTVAARVLQKAQHLLTGIQLQVSPFNSSNKSLLSVVDTQYDKTQLSCAIIVQGLTPAASREMIMLLFENRKRSGGGLIEELVYVAEEGRAVITFESPDGSYWRGLLGLLFIVTFLMHMQLFILFGNHMN